MMLCPIRPEDEPALKAFFKSLSEETIRQRYLKKIDYDCLTAHEELCKICFSDYDRQIVLIAKRGQEIVGLARLQKVFPGKVATFSMTIQDAVQKKGLGTKLMEKILEIAKQEEIETITSRCFKQNTGMHKLFKKFAFLLEEEGDFLIATKDVCK